MVHFMCYNCTSSIRRSLQIRLIHECTHKSIILQIQMHSPRILILFDAKHLYSITRDK